MPSLVGEWEYYRVVDEICNGTTTNQPCSISRRALGLCGEAK